MAAYPLIELPKLYRIPAEQVDGMDAGAVYGAVSEAVAKIRRGEGPQFIETHTVRWPGSASNWPTVPVPTNIDLAWDVSSVPENVREWYRASDPVLIFVRQLVERKALSRDAVADLEKNVIAEIDQAVSFALASPFPESEEALRDVFSA